MSLFVGAEVSNKYQTFRPNYPDEVYEFIVNYCKETNPTLDTAIDVGCGTGQSTVPLCQYFRHVIGVDISETQIETARKAHHDKNVTFQVSSAEDLAFQASNSVDLVLTAVAMHWINPDRFYSEVSRVLRRNGSLIIYSYKRCYLEDDEADKIVDKFWAVDLKDYWDMRWRTVDNNYRDVNLPFPNWIRNEEFMMHTEWSVEEVIGYISTWSACQVYARKYPDSYFLDNIYQQLKAIYNGKNKQRKVKLRWPLFMLCGHKI